MDARPDVTSGIKSYCIAVGSPFVGNPSTFLGCETNARPTLNVQQLPVLDEFLEKNKQFPIARVFPALCTHTVRDEQRHGYPADVARHPRERLSDRQTTHASHSFRIRRALACENRRGFEMHDQSRRNSDLPGATTITDKSRKIVGVRLKTKGTSQLTANFSQARRGQHFSFVVAFCRAKRNKRVEPFLLIHIISLSTCAH